MILRSALPLLLLCAPLWAASPLETVQVVTTEHVPLAAGATVRLTHSTGDLNLEAWDQPEVEVTVVRTTFRHESPKEQDEAKRYLDRVRVSAKRAEDGGVEVTTNLPSHNWLIRAFRGRGGFNLNYRIRVPRDARLEIHHDVGTITLAGVVGDISASTHIGDIVVQLPDSGKYILDARSRIGVVYSDFTGHNGGSYLLGQRYGNEADSTAHHVSLRVGLGGISIQRL